MMERVVMKFQKVLIINCNELDQKDQKKKKKRKKETAYYHYLFHDTTTIEKGDDIDAVTFFVAKPLKKATIIIIAIFCSKAIKEGDISCLLLWFYYKEEGDDTTLPSLSFVTTLALGSRPRQGLARVRTKKEAQESHLMLLKM